MIELRYALNANEAKLIIRNKEPLVKVDHKIRKDPKFPAGFQDVISIERTGELFRLLYDVEGRFCLNIIDE